MFANPLLVLTTTLSLLFPALSTLLTDTANNIVNDPPSSRYFNVINLFSYDQTLAIQSNTIPGGPKNAPGSFVQFYLNDQGNGRNGGCQFSWNPSNGTLPPINQTQQLEFDAAKTATLRSYSAPGEFVVDIKHT
jgi:hypothetical protein